MVLNLKAYKKKRRFDETPEPACSLKKEGEYLHFCVQKHAASHLHYDFRLELDGVLLSWAVPKGPSLNPKDKRLAIHVEDHPLNYRTFEGVIPKGNYGAGTVMLWDEGTYLATDASNKRESEIKLRKGIKKGHLEIQLFGTKLKGKFNLVELKQSREKNAWLLIKVDDTYANDGLDVKELDFSVKKSPKKRKSKMPEWVNPMLAKLIEAPFNDENWVFEIKWDGYRALTFIDRSTVRIYSRNKNSFNSLFPPIVEELKKLNTQTILDGEIVVLDQKGKPSFEQLANYRRNQTGELAYFVFDLLFHEGQDLRPLPLLERKERLMALLSTLNSRHIRYNDHIEEKGVEFFKKAKKSQLEGIIGKNKQSSYISKRSADWVKIKTTLAQEVIIGGFTLPKGGRTRFGALLAGVYDKKGNLDYIGNVGGGFDHQTLEEVYAAMEPLLQEKCPFKIPPKNRDVVAWVTPKLICEVSFAEWTADTKMRQPVFHGLRMDKKPKEIKREVIERLPEENSNLTNLNKLYWKKEKYTKGDAIGYYQTVAPVILPYLKNHPLMMHRYPNGIEGENFYQKNIESPPSWMKTTLIEHENKSDRYILVQDERTLLYVANLGSIELHPMISQIKTLNSPDFLAIDLDPEDISFEKVIEVAQWIHEFLEELNIPNYCKTSGGRGLHLYIPLGAKYSFDQTELFAELLAHIVRDKLPQLVSLERMPKKRQKKIYFDYLQNNRGGRTMVAPYSLRAKPGAPVSTPLEWKEVNSKLDPLEFNIKTVPSRIAKIGDPLKNILKRTINLSSVIKKLEKLSR